MGGVIDTIADIHDPFGIIPDSGAGSGLNPATKLSNTLETGDPSGFDVGGKGAGKEQEDALSNTVQAQTLLAGRQEARTTDVFNRATEIANQLNPRALNQSNAALEAQAGILNRGNAALAQGQAQGALGSGLINQALSTNNRLGQLQRSVAANTSQGIPNAPTGFGAIPTARGRPQLNASLIRGLPQAANPNEGNLNALSAQSVGQAGQNTSQLGNLSGFAQGLAAQAGGAAPQGAAQGLQGLAGNAVGEFGRGAVDIAPQIAALTGNAQQLAQLGQQQTAELGGIRQGALGAVGAALQGRSTPGVDALFSNNAATRDALERQFNVAGDAITESTGQRGGALSRSLAGLERARAQAVAQDAGDAARRREEFQQGLFSAGLGQGFGAPAAQQNALQASSGILQGAGAQQLQAEGLRQQALSQAGSLTGTAGAQQLQGVGLQQNQQSLGLQGLNAALAGSQGNIAQNLAAIGQAGALSNQALSQSLGRQQLNAGLQNQGFTQALAQQSQSFNQNQGLTQLQAALQNQGFNQAQANTQLQAALQAQRFGQNQSNINQLAALQGQQFNQLAGVGQQQQTAGQGLQFQTNPALLGQSVAAGQAGLEALTAPLSAFTGQPIGQAAGTLGSAAGTQGQLAAAARQQQAQLGSALGGIVGSIFAPGVGTAAGSAAGGAAGGKK